MAVPDEAVDAENPYAAGILPLAPEQDPTITGYFGFWRRALATLIDTVVLGVPGFLLNLAWYGAGYLESTRQVEGPFELVVSNVLPFVVTVVLWVRWGGSVGCLLQRGRVVDSSTGRAVSVPQAIGRYLAIFLSVLPLGLGLWWSLWEPKKRAWHDLLAGTVVVRVPAGAAWTGAVALPRRQRTQRSTVPHHSPV